MLKSTVETITPEVATEYLKHNTKNYRKLKRSLILQYADEMKAGRWQLNGEPICFNEDEILVNGQHRLAAIVYSGCTIKIVVVRGVKNNVNVYDVGGTRTIGDLANAKGIDSNPTIAGAARIIVQGFTKTRSSKSEITDYIAKNESELNRAYRATCYGNDGKSKTAPCVAASYIMLRSERIPYYEMELFWRLYNNPYNTPYDGYNPTPAFTAMKMIEDRQVSGSGRQLQKERLEIIVRAMEDFHNGVEVGENYKLAEPFIFEGFLKNIRKTDKLEVE